MFFCTVHYLIYYFIFCLVLPGRGPAVRHVEEDRDEEQSADNRRSGEQKGGVHRRTCQIYAPGKSIKLSVRCRICQIYAPGKSIDLSVHCRICKCSWEKYRFIGLPPDLPKLRSWKSIDLSVHRRTSLNFASGKSIDLPVHRRTSINFASGKV